MGFLYDGIHTKHSLYETKMKLLSIFTALFSLLALVIAEEKLQIGITKKIPTDECLRKVQKGDTVQVHYSGFLKEDNSKFDSSLDRGQPLEVKAGVGQLISGFDTGLLNMCIGEKRKLTIPSHLGYGKRGAGRSIPPDADLIFTIELVGIKGYTPPVRDEL
ncbi:putative peptidyl-prolyl isomerase [Wickerhamomyces ciferrii]|uniref:peptidylprolyl isomerase n=1 Tax=Wickerhamomyces ciferrii (strain ATCC 14091 / BCRC 22168 / CBS 111 / JCM 3599 / NBRC 0793 / NRRL Y-1031 F-60-10) TaxID=1206466 RepID=K0KHQ9_WICCF|nr:putative peptidyl-prolyl isomerase [Wickerhamomyces ciferrii]CCH41707.1 putative peptidyl-prolyl isomerase [Wickerhamomyces ciferrii]